MVHQVRDVAAKVPPREYFLDLLLVLKELGENGVAHSELFPFHAHGWE